MKHFGAVILAGATLLGTAAAAFAPYSSIRPKPREALVSVATRQPPIEVFYRSAIRPRPRPANSIVAEELVLNLDGEEYTLASTRPIFKSPRPERRPGGLRVRARNWKPTRVQKPVKVASTAPTAISRSKSLCGDPTIKGEVLAPIAGKLPGCGLDKPVRVSSVDGVVLGQRSIMDCTTAKALRKWITGTVKPSVGRRGGGVKSLSVSSHYSCRTRNSQPGAKISEHGKGHAIDISSINLNDGTKITVLDGWRDRRDGKLLRKFHASACGPFGTVLGPESGRFHKDHFHFDTARHRSGPYCR